MMRTAGIGLLAGMGLMLLAAIARPAESGQERALAAGRGLIGTAAPRAQLTTIDGDRIDLGSLYGRKAVYLKFWATWCTPCREQMPHFEHVYQNAGADLAVIAINVGFNDSVQEVQKYRRKLGITMPIVFDDGSLGAAFNLRVTPQSIVIGRDGRILYVGHLADAKLDEALLAAREVKSAPAPSGAPRTQIAAIGVGDTLPARSLQTLDGGSFALNAAEPARPTVLVFLSPWCESYLATTRPVISANCRRSREAIAALAGNPRLRWIGIASGLWASKDDLREYQAKNNIRIPLTLDASGRLFRAFRVTDVPTVLIADAHGRLIQRLSSDDPEGLRKAIVGL